MSRQLPDGSWPQESIEGSESRTTPASPDLGPQALTLPPRPVFNKNAAISYPNFKFAWTINALGQAWKKLPRDGW